MRILLVLACAVGVAHADGARELAKTKTRLLSTFASALRQGPDSKAFARFRAGLAAARKAHGFVAAADVTEGALAALDAAQATAIEALDAHWLEAEPLRMRLAKALQSRRRTALQTVLSGRYKFGARETLDARLKAVAQVWTRPLEVLPSIDPETKQRTAELARYAALRTALDPEAPDPGAKRLAALRAAAAKALDPRLQPVAKWGHAALVRRWRDVQGGNEGATWASAHERLLVKLTNDHRVMLGRHAVELHESLAKAARGHASHMNTVKVCEHTIGGHPFGDSPDERAKRQGYGGAIGENVLVDTSNHAPKWALYLWQGSPGHHRTMLREHWRDIGVGRGGFYWAQVFGSTTRKRPVRGVPHGIK